MSHTIVRIEGVPVNIIGHWTPAPAIWRRPQRHSVFLSDTPQENSSAQGARRFGEWHGYFTRGNFVSVSVFRNATIDAISASVSFRFPMSCVFTCAATSGGGQPARATSRVL